MAAVDDITLTTVAELITHTVPNKQMLRVTVNDQPCTAVLMKDNRVLEVKGPHPRVIYASKEAWAESLGVTEDQIVTSEDTKAKKARKPKEKAKEKPKKAKKEKAVPPKKCNVPRRVNGENNFMWMKYVHDMMVEANVPITEEIIDEYNQLMSYLEGLHGVRIFSPYGALKYMNHSIMLRKNTHTIAGLNMYFNNDVAYGERAEICTEIMRLYTPLCEKMSPIVIPYITQQHEYISAKGRLVCTKKLLLKVHDQIEHELERHATQMKYMHARIKQHQADIDKDELILASAV
jgi:hypothetical protein